VSAKHFLQGVTSGPAPTELLIPIGFPAASRPDSQYTSAVPVMPGLSMRSNFAWVLAGNVVYAACQWGMIVALAKLGSTLMVGQFSLGLAIATPVLMFTNLHLRAAQATDARRLYVFAEYLQLRSVMTVAGMAVIAGIAWFEHYERQTTIVVLTVALAKGIEMLSDIHYGLFQLNDRLDQTARSMMFRGALSVVALSLGLYLTHNVVWGCVGLALAGLAALLFFDIRRVPSFVGRQDCPAQSLPRQWNLMCLALPLGIVTTLASINLNMPRYFIEARLGEHQLGIFSALAYATVAITLVSDSLGHCAIPRMSRLHARGQTAEFRSAVFRLSAIGCALGLAGLAVAEIVGARLLTIFYSPQYAAGARVFVVLMLATAIHCVSGMLTSGILAARFFMVQVPMFVVVVASTALACWRLVPTSGLMGGAEAMVVGAVVRLVLAAFVVGYLLLPRAKNITLEPSPRPRIDEWNSSL